MERREKVNACKELAKRSGQWTSFDPERHAEVMLDDMESGLRIFLDALPEEVRDDYEDRYIEKFKEWLSAQSRCFSQAITGASGWKPATFRRNEKTNAAERNAYNRLQEWCQKVIKRCNRQERLTGWAEVERLEAILEQLTENQEKMKAANKIVRSKRLAEVQKLDELVALGYTEEIAIKLLSLRGWWGAGFAPFELSNNNSRIKDTEAKIHRHRALAERGAGGDEVHEHPWGKVVVAFADERYRFIFDGKPEPDVISLLKSNGFKWSPKNAAWQRQITANAKYAVKRVIEVLNAKNNVA
jgi:hypothetical protein